MVNANLPLPAERLSSRRLSLAQKLAFIAGGICLIGFVIDILVIGLPPNPLAPQWRLNFLQQVAERSLLLFVGNVLLFYSLLDSNPKQLKKLSMTCLVIGLLLCLSSLMVIKDNFTLQNQALVNITNQATELRDRISEGREDTTLNQDIDPESFTAALRSVDIQAENLRQDTQTGAMKTLISSAGNLLLFGAGLIGIGRLGLLISLPNRRRRRVHTG